MAAHGGHHIANRKSAYVNDQSSDFDEILYTNADLELGD